jgi:hypothetical protein
MEPAEEGDAGKRLRIRWYADRFDVGANAFEFFIDCGHEGPEHEIMIEYCRIIANPLNARQLFRLLGAALVRYGDDYGGIGQDDAGTGPGSGA